MQWADTPGAFLTWHLKSIQHQSKCCSGQIHIKAQISTSAEFILAVLPTFAPGHCLYIPSLSHYTSSHPLCLQRRLCFANTTTIELAWSCICSQLAGLLGMGLPSTVKMRKFILTLLPAYLNKTWEWIVPVPWLSPPRQISSCHTAGLAKCYTKKLPGSYGDDFSDSILFLWHCDIFGEKEILHCQQKAT